MADRFPLVVNPETRLLEELAEYDNLNLTNSGIVGATTITSNQFIGNLVGSATSAYNLYNAEGILSGTIDPDRLSGTYNINVSSASTLNNASNMLSGTVPRQRLSGDYDVNITGTANTANNLSNAANITSGIINKERLTGVYDISITGSSFSVVGSAQSLAVFELDTNSNNYLTFADTVDGDSKFFTDSQGLVYNPQFNYLGIGTNLPKSTLDILGNVNISGISTLNYLVGTGISISGISTLSNLDINSVRVLDDQRIINNILGIDTITKQSLRRDLELDLLENIFVTGISTFENLNVTGLSTFNDVSVDGSATFQTINAQTFLGLGDQLTGIVTTIVAGIGVTLNPLNGKGEVIINAYKPIGKTIFVTQSGNDLNTGLTENDSKLTIKAASEIAEIGDTIKVYPGVYVENNPILLKRGVAVEGTELRNCIVSPQNVGQDLFHVNNSVHITDLSFIGQPSTNNASVVAFQPLSGVSSDRFFDAARMIRYNLDFIAAEAVGYLTSTDYKSPAFTMSSGDYTSCKDDIKDIFKAVCHDITRGGNSKCVGAGKSYYTEVGALQHIVGVKTETIDALNYAAGIAKSCINNVEWNGNYQNEHFQIRDLGIQPDGVYGNQSIDGCANVVSAIYSCIGVVTTIIDQGLGVLGVGFNTTYPGNSGAGSTIINDPSFSPGVGPITQGPYVRNCTNFIPNSIGLKIDGFHAEPGDQDDIGVTGSMSVDSYTQYNQGGIGVSITNGAYAQLVSIFTICNDTAIFTGSGGQCDITNSNSSFGTRGLVSDGVGDELTKSIYRHTGVVLTESELDQATVEISNIGNLRPYDGQAIYFGELYYEVQSINVIDGGYGYTEVPEVTIDVPGGPNGITAEAIASIDSLGRVTSIDIISSGSQYRPYDSPSITISPPTGVGVTATASLNLYPIYYKIESSTKPSAGISTIILTENLNNTVSAGTTVYFNRLSLQIASSHSFEWVGSGNDINIAKPALGGVTIQENEVVKINGGEIVYTSTDQSGNFRIGDDVVINQLTGTLSGRATEQNILNTVTPLIIALGK